LSSLLRQVSSLVGMGDDKNASTNKEEKERGRDDGYCSSNESDFDLQPNAFLQSCPHLDSFRESANICDPSLWHCRECSTTESVWVCLACGYFGCGRYQNGHAKIHFQQTEHPLVLEINEKLCYCYPCKNYVTNDTPDGAIGKIRQKLEEEQTQRDHANKRKKLRNSAIFKKSPSSFEKQDKLVTIIQQWKMYHLYRAFNKWKHVWKANKNARAEGHGENNVSTTNQNTTDSNTNVTDVTMTDVENNNNAKSNSNKSSKKRAREETEEETKAAENEGNKKGKKRKTEKEPSVVLRKIIKPGETGLRNLGNTCYMNSILQSLSNTTLFRDYFLWHLIPRDKPAVINKHVLHREPTVNIITSISKSPVKHGDEVLLTKEIHNLLRVMWSGKWAVVTPYSLLQGIWTCLPKFHSHQQQDVQEFLCYVLDRLNSELMGDKNAQNSAPASSESKAKLRKSFSSLRMSLTGKSINSIINEVFEGQLLSEIRCMECGHRSNKKDPFLDLSLEIPEQFVQTSTRASRHKKVNLSCDLSECIDGFMRAEELGPDSYWCEQCKAKKNATKKFYIARPPKVLVLVIKRFCWTTSARAKVDTQIRFPLKGLDVAQHIYQDPTANGNATMSTSEPTTRYNLRSLIVHHGVRLLSGHYSCYCFNDEKGAWVHFNDTQVTVETPEEVESAQPYMLFYERDDTEPSNRSQEPMSEEDLDVRMLEDLSVEMEEEEAHEEEKKDNKKVEPKIEPKSAEEQVILADVPNNHTKPAGKQAAKKQAPKRATKAGKAVKKAQSSSEESEELTDIVQSDGPEMDSSDADTKINNNKNNNNDDDQDEESSQDEQSSVESSESAEPVPKNKSKTKAPPTKKTPAKAAPKKKAPARKDAPASKAAPKKATAKPAASATSKTSKTTGTKSTTKSLNTKTSTEIPKKSTATVTTRSAKKIATSATAEPKTASNTTKKTRRR
jgi:ubiquitin carboxyl-terminal hydrolase 44/49